MLLAVALIVGFILFMRRTRTGRTLRAIAQDREAALLQGVNVERYGTIGFSFGAVLAGLAGSLLVVISGVNSGLGTWISVDRRLCRGGRRRPVGTVVLAGHAVRGPGRRAGGGGDRLSDPAPQGRVFRHGDPDADRDRAPRRPIVQGAYRRSQGDSEHPAAGSGQAVRGYPDSRFCRDQSPRRPVQPGHRAGRAHLPGTLPDRQQPAGLAVPVAAAERGSGRLDRGQRRPAAGQLVSGRRRRRLLQRRAAEHLSLLVSGAGLDLVHAVLLWCARFRRPRSSAATSRRLRTWNGCSSGFRDCASAAGRRPAR